MQNTFLTIYYLLRLLVVTAWNSQILYKISYVQTWFLGARIFNLGECSVFTYYLCSHIHWQRQCYTTSLCCEEFMFQAGVAPPQRLPVPWVLPLPCPCPLIVSLPSCLVCKGVTDETELLQFLDPLLWSRLPNPLSAELRVLSVPASCLPVFLLACVPGKKLINSITKKVWTQNTHNLAVQAA